MSSTSHAVFISYASQDAEAAGRICEALRGAGIEVWFDQSELRGGDAWDQSIRKQIKTCALFLPVISRSTHDRREGYFRLEWKLAVDRSHLMDADMAFLLPVVIDDTRDDDERVPERFREVQWTRLPGGVTPAAFVERVRRLLSGELSQEQTRTESAAARGPAAPTSRKPVLASWRSKAALLATIAVFVVALGYLVANRLVLSKRGSEVGGAAGSAAQNASATAFNPLPHSVAVLPFTNLSGDPKQDYFSDGVSEELINALSHIDALEVAARTSSFSFKNQNADIGTIARKLNVAALLEGSIRRSGNKVRITAQLINAVNGFHMWSEDYDRDLKDVLALQTDIATAVARQLQVKLLGNEAAKIEVGGTSNPEAYIAYLHGTHLEAVAESEADYRAALAAFDQAIALDPNYAAAYAYRAGLLVDILSSSTDSHSRESLRDQARRAAERSIALAPALADAHRALWLVRAIGYLDFAGAAPEIERARTLAPGNARVLEAFAGFEVLLGHAEAAVAAAQRAVALDALNYDSRVRLVLVLYYARRFSDALGAAQEARALRPKGSQGRDVEELTAASYLAPGQADEARQLCESPAMPLNDVLRRMLLSIAYRALGKAEQADNELAKFMAVAGDSGAFNYARIYAQQGNTALALQWLATAEHLHDPFLQLLRVDWMLDPIRNTPQFKALEARMNFPP